MNKKKPNRLPILLLLLGFGPMIWGAWTTRRITNDSGYSEDPAVAVNGATVYVVWHDQTPGNAEIYFRKSIDNGDTWQAAKRLTYNSTDSQRPRIAVLGEYVYVVWEDGPSGNEDIYFRRSIDGGNTWQGAKQLTNNGSISGYPDIAASGANVYVVWHDYVTHTFEIYLLKSTDNGSTWQSAKQLTFAPDDCMFPAIAADSANVYVVWGQGSPSDIYFRKSINGGGSWQNVKRLSNNEDTSDFPRIALNGQNIYLVWHDYSATGFAEIYFKRSTDGGAKWKPTMRLSFSVDEWGLNYPAWYPDIAVRGAKVYVTWTSMLASPGNRDDIYFRKSVDSGATWRPVAQLTDNAGYSYNPAIAVNDTNVYVIWDDDTPLNAEIYVKFSPK